MSIPPGFSPPFATVTPTDHRAWIIIATALCMACYVFFGVVRVGLRAVLRQPFEFDDFTCWAASCVAVIQSILVLVACSKGLGKSVDLLSSHRLVSVEKLYYASNFFFILAIATSKISTLCLIHRISRSSRNRKATRVAMGVASAWAVGAIFALAFECRISHPWLVVGEKCTGILTRWYVISAIDIATELGIFALVVHLVYPLRMKLVRKVSVAYMFSYRLLVIIFISFRLHALYIHRHTLPADPSLHLAPYICWTQAQLAYDLITATVPAFRNFLKSLHTGFGGISALERSYGYGSQLNSGGNATKSGGGRGDSQQLFSGTNFKMTRLTPRPRGEDNKTGADGIAANGQAPTTAINAAAAAAPSQPRSPKSEASDKATTSDSDGCGITGNHVHATDTTSIASNESSRMMIRKDVNWSVRTEPRLTYGR